MNVITVDGTSYYVWVYYSPDDGGYYAELYEVIERKTYHTEVFDTKRQAGKAASSGNFEEV